jgi:hypothetical protein
MARLSRVTGPTAEFELTAAFAKVPQLEIRRLFQGGPCLIVGNLAYGNVTGGTVNVSAIPYLDGAALTTFTAEQTTETANYRCLNFTILAEIPSGEHGIAVYALGNAAAGDSLRAGLCNLAVIELPAWEAVPSLT